MRIGRGGFPYGGRYELPQSATESFGYIRNLLRRRQDTSVLFIISGAMQLSYYVGGECSGGMVATAAFSSVPDTESGDNRIGVARPFPVASPRLELGTS